MADISETTAANPVATERDHNLIASDRVEGTVVYNREGEKLGTVKNFMVDKRSGKAEYAVMEFGGLFGIGSDLYPLPWDLLDYDPEAAGYVVDLDKEKLKDAPSYRERHPTWDQLYGQHVYGYYGMAYPYI